MIRFAICDDGIMYMNSIKEIVSETFDKMKSFDEECGELSGFEIAKQMTLKKKDLGIVYITNHQHYVTEAVEEYVGQLSTYEDLLMNNNFIKISREYGES